MNTQDIFVEVGAYQVCKYTEKTPGDRFVTERIDADGRIVAVLSDGLGSGVKANVLSTLTATIAARCIKNNVPVSRVAEVITETLPVCSRRKISYATFTIIEISADNHVRIIEYDNPPTLIFRHNEPLEIERRPIEFKNASATEGTVIPSRVFFSEFQAQRGDRILTFSDGLPQSGMGTPKFPLGFTNGEVFKLAQNLIHSAPKVAAQNLARQMVRAGIENDKNNPHDDITCGVICFREPRKLLLVSGPPFKKESDTEMVNFIKQFDGTKIVCGGTTANIVSRLTEKPLESFYETGDRSLPPISHMEGVDLVTEGVITLSKVEELLQAKSQFDDLPDNGALKIIEKFLNSDCIFFLVGTKINETHLSPTFPVELEIRRTLMRRIAQLLEVKFMKHVKIQYI